jgi:hypothetical protein
MVETIRGEAGAERQGEAPRLPRGAADVDRPGGVVDLELGDLGAVRRMR